ncbi:hypothetical protein QO010_003801 [Caulobacter ginsengisoli]|uniref:Uncharacterized protein n=1 Tax=Caulobacter ginsengisoli TaxID=400775 RepID=A0ABU0IVG2_9CAUL|nr:hypothetical protein [Caulobacter ginsengisoli]MDQ0466008.1 hypothetical protein [Caulobacter ginsengisoli]
MIKLLGSIERRALRLFMALMVAAGLACSPVAAMAATYVSAELGDVKPEDKAKVESPQPVQLLFQFKTKGSPNAAATKFLKAKVTEIVTNSGLFSSVSEAPVANGAVLSVVIDNVITPEEMSKATGQGVKTGATLFIAGSNITDHYVSTLEYVSGPGAPKITRSAKHALITQMGLINSAPEGAVKIGSMKDGVFTMASQIILNPLNDIAKDPAFAGGTPGPADAPAAPADAVPATPAAPPAPEPAPAAAPAEPTPTPQG